MLKKHMGNIHLYSGKILIYNNDVVLPRPEAISFVNDVKKDFYLGVVTNCYPGTVEAKIEHIIRHFGSDIFAFIVDCHRKHFVSKFGILVDDNVGHVNRHCHHNNKTGIVFNFNNSFGWSKITSKNLDFYPRHKKLKSASNFDEAKEVIYGEL